MNIPGLAIAIGCIFVGIVLSISAIAQWRTGVTLAGRGGPSGPITRDDRPADFWLLFWVRAILGPVATLGGLAGLSHLL